MQNLVLLSCREGEFLAKKILKFLADKCSFIETTVVEFANKEMRTQINESVRGRDVFIVQSFGKSPSHDLVELGILIHTAKLSSARRITAVCPLAYGSRQDRRTRSHMPITIQWFADFLEMSGADRIITVSLHSPHSEAAFRIRIDNLSSSNLLVPVLRTILEERDMNEVAFVSPDTGGLARVNSYIKRLGGSLIFVRKIRPDKNHSEVIDITGDPRGKLCLIVDDIIDTAGSLCNTANKLEEMKACNVIGVAPHLILSEDAIDKIQSSSIISSVIGTDSINHSSLPNKFAIFSLDRLLGEVILRIHEDKPVGVTFKEMEHEDIYT